MKSYGTMPSATRSRLLELLASTAGVDVERKGRARSKTPFPSSTDLERAVKPLLVAAGFHHLHSLLHPRTGERFEYDFWRPADGVAMEVMGYRADDEIYKDILKFHVHADTRIGVVWVPRWKWISGRRTATNYSATIKALAFADTYMAVEALVAVAYDWNEAGPGRWRLQFVQ